MSNNNNNNSIFYLFTCRAQKAVANYRVSRIQTTAIRQHRTKQKKKYEIDHLRYFLFKREFLQISVHLQSAVAAETYLTEGQWLEDHPNMVKLRMFRVGT
jgi:hypothetical protein